MPEVVGYYNRIHHLIKHINIGSVDINLLPDVFENINKLSKIGKRAGGVVI